MVIIQKTSKHKWNKTYSKINETQIYGRHKLKVIDLSICNQSILNSLKLHIDVFSNDRFPQY